MERRFAVLARANYQALIVLLTALSATATAAPKQPAAKAAFDEGVRAFGSKDYAAAAAALKASFALEDDTDTMFAWAQAERLSGNCEDAKVLFERLLERKLPEANANAVRAAMEDCTPPEPVEPPDPTPVEPPPPVVQPPEPQQPVDTPRAWFLDPVGGALTVAGVAGIGVGIGFFVSARSADQAKDSAMTYGEFAKHRDKAEQNGTIAVIAGGAGLVLLGAGIAWYATRDASTERTTPTAWFDPASSSGGFAVSGSF